MLTGASPWAQGVPRAQQVGGDYLQVRRTAAGLLLLSLTACNSNAQSASDAPSPQSVAVATQRAVAPETPSADPTTAASPPATQQICWSAYEFPAVYIAALHVPALHVPALHVPALHVPPLHVPALHVPPLHIAATTINGPTYPAQDYRLFTIEPDYPGHDYPAHDYPGKDYAAQDYPAQNYPAQNYPARQVSQNCKQVASGFLPTQATVLPATQLGGIDRSYSPELTDPLLAGLGSHATLPDFEASGFGELNQAGFPKNQYVPTYFRHDANGKRGAGLRHGRFGRKLCDQQEPWPLYDLRFGRSHGGPLQSTAIQWKPNFPKRCDCLLSRLCGRENS